LEARVCDNRDANRLELLRTYIAIIVWRAGAPWGLSALNLFQD
jgi:hypothetical protein